MPMIQNIQAIAPIAAAVILALFALPSYIALIKESGFARAASAILAISVFILGFEALLIKVGLPYGKFTISDVLGYKIFGLAPYTLALAYPPLVLAAYWLASNVKNRLGQIVLIAVFLQVAHLVLDPATTKMRVWNWEAPGPFYGVPIASFVAWLVAGLFAGWLISSILNSDDVKRAAAYSGFTILWFWAGVNLGLQQWIPGAIGIVASLLMLIFMRREKRQTN